MRKINLTKLEKEAIIQALINGDASLLLHKNEYCSSSICKLCSADKKLKGIKGENERKTQGVEITIKGENK